MRQLIHITYNIYILNFFKGYTYSLIIHITCNRHICSHDRINPNQMILRTTEMHATLWQAPVSQVPPHRQNRSIGWSRGLNRQLFGLLNDLSIFIVGHETHKVCGPRQALVDDTADVFGREAHLALLHTANNSRSLKDRLQSSMA